MKFEQCRCCLCLLSVLFGTSAFLIISAANTQLCLLPFSLLFPFTPMYESCLLPCGIWRARWCLRVSRTIRLPYESIDDAIW